MIIELFGLPGTGKSTRARAWADGARVVRIRDFSRGELLVENARFFLRFPVRFLRLYAWMGRAPRAERASLVKNLFLVHNAKYMKARRISRAGGIALIDQGHFQNALSLFGEKPSERDLARYLSLLPRPDLLAVCEASEETRRARRRERGDAEPGLRHAVAEALYPVVMQALSGLGVEHRVATEGVSLGAVLAMRISYLSIARMPTEKAHGASIAHMCAAFGEAGSETELIVPARRNPLTESVFSYYAVPETFSVRHVRTPDLVGMGLTHPASFFLQRLLFLRALRRTRIPAGVVYTREPELAAAYARSRYAVLELHRWPGGRAGKMTARLARNAALVVCNSKGTEAAARAAGVERTLVAPNGFDARAFAHAESAEAARARLGLPLHAKVAMYVGALESHKGVEILCAAAERVPEVLVAVIGGSAAQTAALAKRYPRVRFLGSRPYRELADNLAAADALVLPNTARDEEAARFTSPIKAFGYMAAGKPIVASDLPSTRELLDESSAFLVAPDDPDALAGGIRQALSGEGERRTEEAKRRVAASTWDARASAVLAGIASSI